jgi:VWFA-related protein
LQESDIRIKDDGKLRPVAFFRFAGSKREVAPAGQGEYINRPGLPPTLILFDRWNEKIMLAAEAWGDIGKALQSQESVERIYIYFLTAKGDLYPVHPLPPADSDLRGAPPVSPAQLRTWFDDAVKKLSGFRDMDVFDPGIRADTTFKALSQLGNEMSAIAGQKNLLWVTRGFPLAQLILGQDLDFTPAVRRTSTLAVEAKIAISAVDESERGAGADPSGESRQTLEMFTGLTGGRWYQSGDTPQALDQSLKDARAKYRVAFFADYKANDKKEHKIRIESSRKDVRFVTREGYFGNTPEPDPDMMEKASLNAESHSPFDASEIAVRVNYTTDAQGEHLKIHVNPSDILLVEKGDHYQGHLGVAFAVYSGGTFKGITKPESTDLNLTKDQFAQAQKDGYLISEDLPPVSGMDRLRVMVYDGGLHGLGTVTIPLN